MNDNDRNDTDMNNNLQNGDESSAIGLLNIHSLHPDKKSSNLNDMSISVDNVDGNGDYFYMNSSNGSKKIHNYVDYTKKRDNIFTNKYLMEILDYWMVQTFMLYYMYPHLTNMSICNTIMNIRTFREKLTFQRQTTNYFQH